MVQQRIIRVSVVERDDVKNGVLVEPHLMILIYIIYYETKYENPQKYLYTRSRRSTYRDEWCIGTKYVLCIILL